MPQWCIKIGSRMLPWIEIIIAFVLLTGITEIATAYMVLALFGSFLALKLFLLTQGCTEDCGCYGSARPERVDGISLAISTFLVLIAVVYLWLVINAVPVAWACRLIASVLFVGIVAFLLKKIMEKRHLYQYVEHPPIMDIGGLTVGEKAPSFVGIDQNGNTVCLDDFHGYRRLLVFVLPGCPACPGALGALREIPQDWKDVVVLVIGASDRERNTAYAAEQNVLIPLLTLTPDLIKEGYLVHSFPIMFILDEMGRISAKGIVNRAEHLRDLMRNVGAISPSSIEIS